MPPVGLLQARRVFGPGKRRRSLWPSRRSQRPAGVGAGGGGPGLRMAHRGQFPERLGAVSRGIRGVSLSAIEGLRIVSEQCNLIGHEIGKTWRLLTLTYRSKAPRLPGTIPQCDSPDPDTLFAPVARPPPSGDELPRRRNRIAPPPASCGSLFSPFPPPGVTDERA